MPHRYPDLELDRRLDRLNEAIVEAEAALRLANLRVGASILLDPNTNDHRLGFGKTPGGWRLYIERGVGDRQPLINASQEVRVLAAKRLETLFKTLVDTADERADSVDDATKTFLQFARELRAVSGAAESSDESDDPPAEGAAR